MPAKPQTYRNLDCIRKSKVQFMKIKSIRGTPINNVPIATFETYARE